MTLQGELLGLDLGRKRTGVARMHTEALMGEALGPIDMTRDMYSQLKERIASHNPCALVVGVPRGLDGQHTEQTQWALQVIRELRSFVEIPVYEIDEAGTTKAAEQIVREGQSIDSVAATIMLDDFVAGVARGEYKNVSI